MAEPTLNLAASDAVKTTTCYMCACRCGIKVHLKDGRVRYIQGNREHPVNRGVLCAKGSAGIMQHYSPARLSAPLKRVGPRGSGEFVEIGWDEALTIASERMKAIRARDPNQLAFFTGRDQSQALTGWWAQQFGTVNYAAHGGFCSVNMAAAGLYSIGGSFWEFGEPDWEHTEYLLLFGVAEDHDSNPIKLGLGQLKGRGVKIVAINPVKTGYGAIADEWIGIRPGTDGRFILAIVHELLRAGRIDEDYLVRYTDAAQLIVDSPGTADDGLHARDADGQALVIDSSGQACRWDRAESVKIFGEMTLPDGRRASTVFKRLAERYLDAAYSPDAQAQVTGVPAATVKRIAAELAHAAFERSIELQIPWTDTLGRAHPTMRGRPVSMHAMRGISAHANGFQTCRALHVLQMLLGAIDTPGSHRYQAPFPKPIPPGNRPGKRRGDSGLLDGAPLGFPQSPDDLLVDDSGRPQRIDKAFSWDFPLSVHGLLQNVIRNAHNADPYPIDTLFLYMANMSWNSSMATGETINLLTATDDRGNYKIPYLIYVDAYSAEMVRYADLVLPDTTYLERHDCISLLDRPISDADRICDSIRQPVVEPDRDVRAFQSVLIDLGARIGLPGLIDEVGAPRYPGGFAQYMVEHQRAPGIGLLAGWRGANGDRHGRGEPNPQQLERYIDNGCFFVHALEPSQRYYKMANRDYLDLAARWGFIPKAEQIVLKLYAEPLQRFRLAAQGFGDRQPPESHRARILESFDPLPIWLPPLGWREITLDQYPISALTQRPMFMYHSWGSQNRWLRQIAARNVLYVHPETAAKLDAVDGDLVEVTSHSGAIVVPIRAHAGVEPGTVWTWNAIGKQKGAWRLSADAPESRAGFLLNHVISDLLPGKRYANADPITGQAAWFDLRVRLAKQPALTATTE
jgi:sulfite dehydrogenase (quinone) subunit SoeA